MAEGLASESQKSLQMEAEMEKNMSEFDTEREQLKVSIHWKSKASTVLRRYRGLLAWEWDI